jgi:hypothetical protein
VLRVIDERLQALAAEPKVAIGEGWAAPVDETDEQSDQAPAAPTHALNAAKAVAYVESLSEAAELEAAREGEQAHPTYPGGRSTVLRVIDERLQALAAEPEA